MHTKGQLFAQGAVIGDDKGCVVADLTATGIMADAASLPERKANAARLRACWNAFEGIDTEAITPGLVGEMLLAIALTTDSGCPHWREPGKERCAGCDKALALLSRLKKEPK